MVSYFFHANPFYILTDADKQPQGAKSFLDVIQSFRHFLLQKYRISAQHHAAMVITASRTAKRNDREEEREVARPLGMVAGHAV